MKRLSVGRVLVTLAALCGAETALAAPAIVSCHGCTDSQASRAASAQVPMSARAGIYDVYVVNSPARRLLRFRITAEREPGMRHNYVRSATPASSYRNAFEDWVSAWHGIRSELKAGVRLPADFPVASVTEVFMSRSQERKVTRALNRDLFVLIGGLAGSALQTVGEAVFSARVFATVRFPDGTTAIFDIVGVDPLDSDFEMLRFEYRKGSARDSEGNAVPDRVSAFDNHEGTYRMRGNLDRLIQMIRLFDVSIREEPKLPATVVCVRTAAERYCWVRKP